jgi:hypothetical protein
MEIPRASRDRLPLILASGVTTATLFYFLFTAAGLRVFRSPQPNFIVGLEGDRLCRFLLIVSTVTKMPLSAHPAREILLDYLKMGSKMVTAALFIAVYVIFIFSGNLANSVSLVGACGSLSASFIFPSLQLRLAVQVTAGRCCQWAAGTSQIQDTNGRVGFRLQKFKVQAAFG